MSEFVRKMGGATEVIKNLLTRYPELRDSDPRLISNFWYLELQKNGKNVNDMTASQLLKRFSLGSFTSTETIRRTRQKLQEKYPELRGSSYERNQADGKSTRKKIVHV